MYNISDMPTTHEDLLKIKETMERNDWDINKLNEEIERITEERKKEYNELVNHSKALHIELCLNAHDIYSRAIQNKIGFASEYKYKAEFKEVTGKFVDLDSLYKEVKSAIYYYRHYLQVMVVMETVGCNKDLGACYKLIPFERYSNGTAIYKKSDCKLLLEDVEIVKLIELKLNPESKDSIKIKKKVEKKDSVTSKALYPFYTGNEKFDSPMKKFFSEINKNVIPLGVFVCRELEEKYKLKDK